jgi:GAF domain-containing protein
MLRGAAIVGLIALPLGLATNPGPFQNTVFIASYVLLLAVTFVKFPYWVRMSGLLLMIYTLGLTTLLTTGIVGDGDFFFLALVVFATVLFSPRIGWAMLGVMLLTYAVLAVLIQTGSLQLTDSRAVTAMLSEWISTPVTNTVFCVALILGLGSLQREFIAAEERTTETVRVLQTERATLEERVEARTLQLQAVNEVGRAASSILDPQDLAGRVANLITEHFGYYYAALFLVDEVGDQAWLYSATGEAGRLLKENKHHLKVGGNSMVGMAISTARPRVALDVGEERVRFQNPLLPYTRSEIALPLVIGERVLGALDVQSTKAGAFGPQEIDTLQGMATQVAIALDNARLFESAQKSLDEMEAVQRQFLSEAWRPFSSDEKFEYRVGEDEAGEDNRLQIPLALREQVIGEINLAGEGEWTAEQRNLVETVAAQAALALENARLVEQSQATARYEHQLAEITGKIWTATTVEGILQTAIKELGQAFDANDARIQLTMESRRE